MDPKEILSKILEITNYQDDKELFVKTFFDACQEKAIYESIKDGQELDPQVYAKHLTEITEKALRKYLLSLVPKLTEEEKTNLREYFKKSS